MLDNYASTTLQAIGNTPLVRLNQVVPPNSADVFVKLEYYNPTGSYKDRMALAMIEEAERSGALKPGMTVVECTGGSTGTSLAFVCAVKGYSFQVVTSDAFAKEKLQTMRAFGADLIIVASEGGRITPDLIPSMREKARQLSETDGTYFTDQINNPNSMKGYSRIGQEILQQLDRPVDAFCGGVGTAGMLMGVSRAFREANQTTRIIALEPASAPLLSTGTRGTHTVEGIGIGMVPPLLSKDFYDEVRTVDEIQARQMARMLAKKEGIFAGISSGLNITAALQLAQELGPGHTVVTVACDSGMKYLSGSLYTD
ncbi:PLP-dependent cysteine synthase family protein [Spirosoma endbachense]|uniref:cysteine synthase n=1 Tax=Spirosoma endbachense TaxID=2666025 RepID=A0A6P1VTX4_9BACT|nr:cysteine synthase family protein [Spirosoma endbachense]QHV96064.1 pyridoxal-phosphate dependent enzyme [Spirosoma endbachense]